MIKRKLSFIDLLIMVALILIIYLFCGSFKKETPELELKEEKKSSLHSTNSDIYIQDPYNKTVIRKTFFKLKHGIILNIYNLDPNCTNYIFDNEEKIRYAEWIDSWGVLTMDDKK